MKKHTLPLILTALLLTGCAAGPAVSGVPAPSPAPVPSDEPTPTHTPSPWDTSGGAMDQITIEGFPFNLPLEALDQAFLDTLAEDTEEAFPWEPLPDYCWVWRYQTYAAPGLQLVTARVDTEVLEGWLEEGKAAQEEYDEALGREYIYAAHPLDGTYSTVPGLKLGDSAERCRELGYEVEEGENTYPVALFNLYVTVENGVVTDLCAVSGGRIVGPFYY